MFNKQKLLNFVVLVAMVASLFFGGGSQVKAQTPTTPASPDNISGNPLPQKPMTNAERAAAAQRASKARAATAATLGPKAVNVLPVPGGAPDYFGIYPNWANSPFPASISNLGDGTGAVMTVTQTAGVVTAVNVLSGGSGYTAAATNATSVTVVGGGGTGAVLAPVVDPVTGAILSVGITAGGSGYSSTPGIRKFVDTLPGLGPTAANDLGNYISVGVPDQTIYPGSDYYEIAAVQYKWQFSADLPPSTVRTYVQIWSAKWAADTGSTVTPVQLFYPDGVTPIKDASNANVFAVYKPSYLGPTIVAQENLPVRVKFTNYLPAGTGGNLFIPVDTSDMGAGMGPLSTGANAGVMYTQNRADIHLHGGMTPWISDGTPHQWITPAADTSAGALLYPKGVSVQNVPDMPDPGPGSQTLFYTNQQSARLMFYHDHAYGITRLQVYAGMAAGYLIQDQVEKDLQAAGILPANTDQIPLVFEDKSFVPSASQLAAEDPTWDSAAYGGLGNLWFPHVYMTNQNPSDISGANPMGRWDYALWFWPPVDCATLPAGHCLITNTFFANGGSEPAQVPSIPQPSLTPEAFMDTPTVNGTAYPVLTVDPKPYRFRILNASNDRMINLQIYTAASNAAMWNLDGVGGTPGTLADANAGEVPMVPAVATPGYPANWPTDGRAGGVPDPAAAGPNFVQIGTEGGFLPAPVVIPNQPVGYNYNRRDIVVLNVQNRALFLAPAERADVVVDFSQYAGKTLIVYNDAPAPVPAFDTRLDYYTGDPDQTQQGGAPTTLPGYGPNTRTWMQIKVNNTSPAPFNLTNLQTVWAHGQALVNTTALPSGKGVFEADQPPIIVPVNTYTSAYGAAAITLPAGETDPYYRIQDLSKSFIPLGGTAAQTIFNNVENKTIQELFELNYGRMNATLGVELPTTNYTNQTTVPLGYIDPLTENLTDSVTPMSPPAAGDGTQIWKITHNGVDTHVIHFHLFNVQLINRVGWDGAVRPPDPNELGWKESVRMNPLEDAIVALRPTAPKLPFGVPDSIRPLDPSQPLGTTWASIDPITGNPITVTNVMTNFHWEYVWHCHILGHEENDMMRPMAFNVISIKPAAPNPFTVLLQGSNATPPSVVLKWTDPTPASSPSTLGNLNNEIGFRIDRAVGATGAFNPLFTALANSTSYTDTSVGSGITYRYRVVAFNAAGQTASTTLSAAIPAAGTWPISPIGFKYLIQANATGTQVYLSWTANTANTTGYKINRTGGTVSFPTVTLTGISNNNYTDTAVTVGTSYIYTLQAVNGTVYSLPTTLTVAVVQTPPAPTNLASPSHTQTSITLTWTNHAVAPPAFGTQIFLSLNGTTWTSLGSVSGTISTFTATGLTNHTTRPSPYYFRLQAYYPIPGTTSYAYSTFTPVITVNTLP